MGMRAQTVPVATSQKRLLPPALTEAIPKKGKRKRPAVWKSRKRPRLVVLESSLPWLLDPGADPKKTKRGRRQKRVDGGHPNIAT